MHSTNQEEAGNELGCGIVYQAQGVVNEEVGTHAQEATD